MHLLLLTRGIQQQVDLWKTFMQTQMWTFKQQALLKDKDGKFIQKEDGTYERGPETVSMVQGALRPIQLYEYVFPEEHLPEVLGMMELLDIGKIRPEVSTPAWLLRKLLKCKPVPEYPDLKKKPKNEITNRYVPTNAVATYPLGIKPDVKKDWLFGDVGFYQEGL